MVLHRVSWFAFVLLALIVQTGQGREQIRLASSPALSPDGKKLAFEWSGDIWIAPTEGGEARQLTTDAARDRTPRWSPDGKEIAFVSDRDGNPQVHLVPAGGGVPRQLTYHSSGSAVLEWLPDGKELLVSAMRDHHWHHGERIFRISALGRGSEEILFDDHGRDGTLSLDGKRLLFTREGEQSFRKGYYGSQASQVWLYDLEKKSYQKLVAGERSARTPLWRPDGKGFYYVANEGNDNALMEFDLGTGKATMMYRAKDDLIVAPCLSRDGSTLVFRQLFDLYSLRRGDKSIPKKIALTRLADGKTDRKERRSLTTASQAAFTADGLEVAFVAGHDLWVMDTELREPRQVTATGGEERNPVFSPEGDAIYFLADAEGKTDVYKAERRDASKFWWLNRQFTQTRITQDGDIIAGPRFTPDGKVSYQRGRGDIYVAERDGKDAKRILESWSRPDYDFSPDGKWLAYAQNDDDFNRDVWIKALNGDSKPINLSRHPNNEFQPVWSPDGRYLAYRGTSAARDADPAISLVYLRAEDAEKSTRDKTLEKALEKMNKARKQGPKFSDKLGDDKAISKPEVTIELAGIRDRIRRISLGTTGSASTLFWSPDGKKLAFIGSFNSTAGTYTIDVTETTLTPRSLSTGIGSEPRWLRQGNQIVWVSSGVPASLPALGTPAPTSPSTTPSVPSFGGRGLFPRGGTTSTTTDSASVGTPYRFTVTQEFDQGQRYAAAFDQCWRAMGENWYDERLGNRDWAKVRTKYAEMAAQATDHDAFATVVNMMLGELNGSHLGFMPLGSGRSGRSTTSDLLSTLTQGTAHLGVRFDMSFEGPGLKVRDVLPTGPADQKRSRLNVGDVILTIDGKPVDRKTDLTVLLNGPYARDVQLTVQGKADLTKVPEAVLAKDGKREVTLRPISYTVARSLLYEKWLRDNRESVEKLSGGKLGYLHISAMNAPSFQKFEEELYSVGAGKDGLVIDVRENGGGSTADHLLTALTQPVHAVTVPRGGGEGYPQDRKVYATWSKPIVVLCNQNSFSNAEIFSHAIKTLKRGQLVGVRTAGGVISTGAMSIMDLGMLRMPTRGWYSVQDGQDMELNGAEPHHVVWPMPGDLAMGKDAQLSKGVEVLLSDVDAWKQRARPKLEKATQRKGGLTRGD